MRVNVMKGMNLRQTLVSGLRRGLDSAQRVPAKEKSGGRGPPL
jgi:hypothetical protein